MHASEQPWSEHNIWLASTGVMLLDSHPQALLLTKSAQYSPDSYLAKFGWILRTSSWYIDTLKNAKSNSWLDSWSLH